MEEGKLIGYSFKTNKNSTIKVTGKFIHSDGSTRYLCECSKCSIDKELFPDGFISTRSSIIKNRVPCPCSNSYRWTEQQMKIRVERECSKRQYIFHGWSGNYIKSHTKLKLENLSNGNIWDTTTINNFLSKNTGCPEDKKSSITNSKLKDFGKHISEILATGKFKQGTKFERIITNNSYGKITILVQCPVCKNDEYSKHKVGPEEFTSNLSLLKQGKVPCRCAKSYRWTKEEREYQLNNILDQEGGTFVEWEDEYKNIKSKFRWSCNCGEINVSSITSFSSGHRCKYCTKGAFNPAKPAIFYIVRWYGYGEEYLKLGITGNFSKRLSEQDRVSKLDHEVFYCFPFSAGQQAADLEKEAKQLLSCGVCPKEFLPDGYSETINVSDLPKLLELINSHVNK